MIKISNVFLVCIFLIISCKPNKNGSTQTINLTKGLKNDRKINLSEIATNIEYIPLETTENSYIGNIKQVKFCNGFIFILDSKAKVIQIFNKKGEYINKINKCGKGPGEYLNPYGLEVDKNDTSIFIFDRSYKLIKYSFKGELVKEWMLTETNSLAFTALNDSFFVFLTTYPRNAFNDGYHLSVYNNDFKLLDRFIKKDILDKENAFSMSVTGNFILEHYCDTLTYWEQKQDIVYKIVDNKAIYPQYKIIYPNPMPLNGKSVDKVKYNSLFGFIETYNYMFFWGNYNNAPFRTVYSKKTKQIVTISLKYADQLNYGFINDIDGGYPFYPDNATSDGKLFCVFSLFELKQFLAKKNNTKTKVISEQKRTELMKLIEMSKPEDNECIMLVTLK
jgi:hypothetical protein